MGPSSQDLDPSTTTNMKMKTSTAKPARATERTVKQPNGVDVQNMAIEEITFEIEGITPLFQSRIKDETAEDIERKNFGMAQVNRAQMTKDEMFNKSLYTISKNKYGHPCGAFKKAIIEANCDATTQKTFPKTVAKKLMYMVSDTGMVEIKGNPIARTDLIRTQKGGLQSTTRAFWPKWSASVTMHFDASKITKEQLTNLFKKAGMLAGIGCWRPSSPSQGDFGRFTVTAVRNHKIIS